jgi:hypothetical protein
MEADWEFEIGGKGPVIEALWPGFIDLQLNPGRACQLPETVEFPALAAALDQLNDKASPVWTSKCGVWTESNPDSFDPDEFDAPGGSTGHVSGCYIDVLAKDVEQWLSPEQVAVSCKTWCKQLRDLPQRCCRADLIIRRAYIASGRFDLGVTAYLTACGESVTEAGDTLQKITRWFAHVLCGSSTLQ